MSAEVFISYAIRDDRERVMPLVDRPRQSGISVWVDEGGIHGATLWGKEIVEAIRHAKGFVLVATKSSFDSKNVVKEVAIASRGVGQDDSPRLPRTGTGAGHAPLPARWHPACRVLRWTRKGSLPGHDRFFESNWGQHRRLTHDANAATPANPAHTTPENHEYRTSHRPVIWFLAGSVWAGIGGVSKS